MGAAAVPAGGVIAEIAQKVLSELNQAPDMLSLRAA
jgi:hypothetical protein